MLRLSGVALSQRSGFQVRTERRLSGETEGPQGADKDGGESKQDKSFMDDKTKETVEKDRVLKAALPFVTQFGWTERSVAEGEWQ